MWPQRISLSLLLEQIQEEKAALKSAPFPFVQGDSMNICVV